PSTHNGGTQRDVAANPLSSVEAHSGLTKTYPGIGPDLSPEKTGGSGLRTKLQVVAGRPRGHLPHRRHDVFGAGADAGGPAGGDGLEAGVEAHAFHAVHRHVAEQGALPAAKAVERHRHRDRHVDADHADLDAVGEFARGIAIAGEDRDAVAVFVVVDELDRVLEIGRPHHRQDRPEDLLPVDPHLGLDLVEQTAAEEKAVLVALQFEAAAIDYQL